MEKILYVTCFICLFSSWAYANSNSDPIKRIFDSEDYSYSSDYYISCKHYIDYAENNKYYKACVGVALMINNETSTEFHSQNYDGEASLFFPEFYLKSKFVNVRCKYYPKENNFALKVKIPF